MSRDLDAEASYFALCLLMPRSLLVEDVRKMGSVDLADDRQVQALADRYQVSVAMLVWRLRDLAEKGDPNA